MSRRKRTVIVLVLIELLLAGGWLWLHRQSTLGHASPDAPRVIGQTFGAAMGLILALSPFLYLLAARHDKQQSPPV